MTAVNKLTTNILQIPPKHIGQSLQTVDLKNPKILVKITCVRNTQSSLNRHGNTFQGMINTSSATKPGAIKNIHSAVTQQSTTAETPLYNPLNRHGNTFQGMINTSSATKPGAIKNIHSAVTQQSTTAETPLYNPLNRHGNTFQGMINTSSATKPGAIKNIHSAADSAINKRAVISGKDTTRIKAVDLANPHHANEGLYNQTHEYTALSNALETPEGCDLDEYLFDSYPLFDDAPKNNPDENSLHKEKFKIYNSFNPLNYTLTYMEPDDLVNN